MKKVITILMIFILSFSLIACGDNAKQEDFDKNKSSSQNESTTIEQETEDVGLKKYIPSQEDCFEIMKSAFPETSIDSSIEHVRHNPDSNLVFYNDFEPIDGQIKTVNLRFDYGEEETLDKYKDVYLRIMISTAPILASQAETLIDLSYSTLIKFFQNMPEGSYPTLQELKENLILPEGSSNTYEYTYSDDLIFYLDWFYGEDKAKRSINLICDIK